MTGISFQTMCIRVLFVSGIPPNSERDWSIHFNVLHTLLCQSIHVSFVDFVFLSLFHYKMTTIFTQKRMTVELANQEDGLD